jgi:hypothetical protein
MIYVPRQWEKTIASWVQTYRQISGLTEEVSQLCLQRFLQGKDQARQ